MRDDPDPPRSSRLNAASLSAKADDKLSRFAYVLTHIFQETRWNRTFRLVK